MVFRRSNISRLPGGSLFLVYLLFLFFRPFLYFARMKSLTLREGVLPGRHTFVLYPSYSYLCGDLADHNDGFTANSGN